MSKKKKKKSKTNFWVIAICSLLILLRIIIPTDTDNSNKVPDQLPTVTTSKKTDIGNCNSFSGSLNENDISELANDCTQYIIRLNGNTKTDIGYMSIEKEALLCKEKGITFFYYNVEGQVDEIGEFVANLMRDGNVHVHCRNGAHRAPAMAAFYLRSIGHTKKQVKSMVGWEELAKEPGDYGKYVYVALK